jgi:hypothetical protein
MAMIVKMVPIATMISNSIIEKPLEFPGSPLVALLSVLFRIARIISDILTCLYSG